MKWSLRIGRLAGIDIFVHATFVLILAWVGLLEYRATGTTAGALGGVVFVLAVFGIVVLHELGHALAARRYGIGTRDITLLPIGGVARLERMPREPAQELVIALAGPAVNVVLAAALWFLLGAISVDPLRADVGILATDGFLSRMFWVNVVLAVFNMIPAFPMDGGRVLRALLAMRLPYARATAVATRFGKFFAILLGIGGMFYLDNPFLVFIALFIWMAAAGEAAAERQTVALEGASIPSVMITDFQTLSPHDPLSRAVEFVLAGFQQDFPVVDMSGALVGVLTRQSLLQALGGEARHGSVEDAMGRDVVTADPREPLEHALQRLRASGTRMMPVVDGHRLLGILTMDNVGEFIMVQTALGRRQGA